jgi:predicted AAA+ superfamily ATPase
MDDHMETLLRRFNPWWSGKFRTSARPRKHYQALLGSLVGTRDVVLITGLRRVGKTTLMHLIIEDLLEEVPADRVLYVSLDHLGLKERSILEIVEAFRTMNDLPHDEHVFLFLDEVHVKEDFELQLKNIYDEGRAKVFASGSASLEITMRAPFLTGRQRLVRVHPLSFGEFLAFSGVEVRPADQHLLVHLAEEYVLCGGLPEHVRTRDLGYLQSVVDTILYKDVAGRNHVRNREMLEDMLALVAQSAGTALSTRKVAKVLGITKESVSRVIDLFEEANLVHLVEKEGKVSERKASPRKVFLADTGLFSVLTEDINLGVIVENVVFLALMRTDRVRYHRRSGIEVDFVSRDIAWESKYKARITEKDLENIRALDGMKGKVVITRNTEGEEEDVKLVPLWKFLLTESEGEHL